jgi:FSR family fosmidomycin resistance protein-like MFS transporter
LIRLFLSLRKFSVKAKWLELNLLPIMQPWWAGNLPTHTISYRGINLMTTQLRTETIAPTIEQEFQTGQVMTIVGGHFVHDTYPAFLASLLPLLIDKLSFSLAQAGALQLFIQAPAILNPFIGYMADILSLRYFVILAPAITATAMSLLGIAPNYLTLAIFLFVAGISTAAFHAPAPAMIGRISGNRLGKGMSFFMAGGELGRAIGPLLAVWIISLWGLDSFYRIMVVGWTASLILYWRLHHIPARPKERQDLRAIWPVARRLYGPLLVFLLPREFMLTGLAVYLPTFMNREGASLWLAGAALSIWELAGVAGVLCSGTFSDRLGRKAILLIATVSASMLLLLFLYVNGWLFILVLLALGFTSLSTTPVIMAMVQEYLPNNRAMANGMFISLAFLLRPVAAFAIGLMGDQFGLHSAFLAAALISLLAIPAIFFLPKIERNEV